MMTKLLKFAVKVTELYEGHELSGVYEELMRFLEEVSVEYLEFAKERLLCKHKESREYLSTQHMLYELL
jgi:isoleucyl-tRNA synthetase